MDCLITKIKIYFIIKFYEFPKFSNIGVNRFVVFRTTWDEHVFEITLPRSVCVGHVDVKFSLHSQCQTPPRIEMTLLKQNATGIGRTKEKFNEHTLVDSTVDFNLSFDSSNTKKG